MRMSDEQVRILSSLMDEIKDALIDYSVKYETEVVDENGINELILTVKFFNDKVVHLRFDLETRKMEEGEDAWEDATDLAIWRKIAFELARRY